MCSTYQTMPSLALADWKCLFDPELQLVSGSTAVWDIYRRQSLLQLLQQKILEVSILLAVILRWNLVLQSLMFYLEASSLAWVCM
jgi:hypothetical protein